MERILVIDDDAAVCRLLTDCLTPDGFQVETVGDGQSGLERAIGENFDVVVLDVVLPSMNGFDVLRRLREQMVTPVIMLSARGEDVDRIVGLELGADDYVPKPFNPRELSTRIRAVLRRTRQDWTGVVQARSAPRTISVGDVEMDVGARLVTRGGERIDLTPVEFNLLEIMLRRAGQLVSRDELRMRVLGRVPSPYDRSIDVHVSHLRRKLRHETAGVERIQAVRNTGYLYALAPEQGQSS